MTAKTKSGGTGPTKFIALAEIWRRETSCEKIGGRHADAGTADKNAQESAAE